MCVDPAAHAVSLLNVSSYISFISYQERLKKLISLRARWPGPVYALGSSCVSSSLQMLAIHLARLDQLKIEVAI